MKKRTIINSVVNETTVSRDKYSKSDTNHVSADEEIMCVSLKIIDTDMHLYQEYFMDNEIRKFINLRSLQLINCNLDVFKPKVLSRHLQKLSLEANSICDLD
jgi:transposase